MRSVYFAARLRARYTNIFLRSFYPMWLASPPKSEVSVLLTLSRILRQRNTVGTPSLKMLATRLKHSAWSRVSTRCCIEIDLEMLSWVRWLGGLVTVLLTLFSFTDVSLFVPKLIGQDFISTGRPLGCPVLLVTKTLAFKRTTRLFLWSFDIAFERVCTLIMLLSFPVVLFWAVYLTIRHLTGWYYDSWGVYGL